MGPDDPTFATEWTVEARSGGACVVRVVHRWFAERDDWDEQFEGHSYGWLGFFRILKLYLTYFRGERGAAFQVMGVGPAPTSAAWEAFAGSLGLTRAAVGKSVTSRSGAPPLVGVVEHVGPTEYPELLLRLEGPAPGSAHLFALPMQGEVYLSVRLYLYGDHAPAAAQQAEPLWQQWMREHFAAAAAQPGVA